MGYIVDCANCDYKENFSSLFMASQDANNHAMNVGHKSVRVYADNDRLEYEAALEEGI